MILSSKNIELRLLDESTLEILRKWRNSSDVTQFMEYQEIISEEAQKHWFENLSKEINYYFIIYTNNNPIGMIHLGDLNKSLRTAESGMFIAEKDYRGTGLAFSASLLLLEFAFKELGLKELFAKVKNDNIQAQDYNKLLGFQEKRKLTNDFSQWSLEKDNYELKMPFLKRLMD
jgi:RimJ/RimL family protein N-acetyltransferase